MPRHPPRRPSRSTLAVVASLEARRLLSAGAPDPTFGVAGAVAGSGPLAVDADRRVLFAGGYTDAAGFHATVTRLLPDGSADPSFGTAGTTTATLDGPPVQIAVEPSGDILVLDGNGATPGGAIQQLTPAGQLNTAFGTGGTVLAGDVTSMVLGAGGAIIAYDQTTLSVYRFTAAGRPDPTFGTDGRAPVPTAAVAALGGSLNNHYGGVTLDAAGRPVVSVKAYLRDGTREAVGLVRLTTAGLADPSFGTDDLALAPDQVYPDDVSVDPVTAPDGSVLLADTQTYPGTPDQVFLYAFTNNGDTVSGGAVAGPASGSDVTQLAVDAQGRPVLAGYRASASGEAGGAGPAAAGFVDRLLPITAGATTVAPDPTFGTAGSVALPFAEPGSLALDPTGDIVVDGQAGGTILRLLGTAPSSVTPVVVAGTVIGSPGSWAGRGNTIANAFDGNLNTFYDAYDYSGDWAGLDLGTAAQPIVQIKFAPRTGFAYRMVGGQFQVSSTPDFSGDVHTIYTVTSAPPAGQLTTVSVGDVGAYRYARYLGPPGGECNVAEVEFLVAGPTPLAGTPIGSPGSWANQGNTFLNAVDGNLNTFYDAYAYTGDWVGLDLGSAQAVTQVRFAPRAGFAGRMVGGVIQASNSASFGTGVVTAYTITSPPPVGTLTTVAMPSIGAYRYWRYLGPAGGECNIAELEFDG